MRKDYPSKWASISKRKITSTVDSKAWRRKNTSLRKAIKNNSNRIKKSLKARHRCSRRKGNSKKSSNRYKRSSARCAMSSRKRTRSWLSWICKQKAYPARSPRRNTRWNWTIEIEASRKRKGKSTRKKPLFLNKLLNLRRKPRLLPRLKLLRQLWYLRVERINRLCRIHEIIRIHLHRMNWKIATRLADLSSKKQHTHLLQHRLYPPPRLNICSSSHSQIPQRITIIIPTITAISIQLSKCSRNNRFNRTNSSNRSSRRSSPLHWLCPNSWDHPCLLRFNSRSSSSSRTRNHYN